MCLSNVLFIGQELFSIWLMILITFIIWGIILRAHLFLKITSHNNESIFLGKFALEIHFRNFKNSFQMGKIAEKWSPLKKKIHILLMKVRRILSNALGSSLFKCWHLEISVKKACEYKPTQAFFFDFFNFLIVLRLNFNLVEVKKQRGSSLIYDHMEISCRGLRRNRPSDRPFPAAQKPVFSRIWSHL